ncbi:MAG: hypothetical protein FJ100_00905 [Deltaproteobacteria bacterium]|nr:hypothetical protein [Deltaproteobacteria bacterium]
MFKNRMLATVTASAMAGALIMSVGCKKKEEAPKATAQAGAVAPAEAAKADDKAAAPAAGAGAVAAPVAADVELAAGDGIALWLSVKSFNALFDAAEMLAGKFGATQPGASLRGQAIGAATAVLAQGGISNLDWLDKTKALHIAYHDQPNPAAPAGSPPNPADVASGIFMVLPVASKDATLAAMPAAAKDAAAEGHAAMITAPKGEKLYIDFLGSHAVVTMMDKDRFAKVKGFAERIAKVDPPSALYLGVSIEDLSKTRAKEIEAAMGMIDALGSKMDGGDPAKAKMNAQVLGMYSKMVKTYITDMTRFELLVHADTDVARVEFRLQAKEGSKLGKQLAAGRGRTTREIANLLPSNSYVSIVASSDPAAAVEQMDEPLNMLKEMFKMDAATFDALAKDMKDLAKMQDGTSGFAVYADGPAALGMLMVGGTTDGEASMRVGKRMVGALVSAVLAVARAEQAAKGKPESAEEAEILKLVESSLKEGKVDPILAKVGPLAEAKGIKLTAATSKDGDIACDVLDIAIDYSKMPQGKDSEQAKAVIGDKTAVAMCAGKTKIGFAAGPGALEKAKAGAAGRAGGLADAPAYKNATERHNGAAVVYVNPGAAIAAFKALVPPAITLPGDKAIVLACVNRTQSFGCALEAPVDLIVAAKALASGPRGGAPAEMAPPAAGGEAPEEGAIKAPEPPPAPAPVKFERPAPAPAAPAGGGARPAPK